MIKVDLGIRVGDEGGSCMYYLKAAAINEDGTIGKIITNNGLELAYNECEDLYGIDYTSAIDSMVGQCKTIRNLMEEHGSLLHFFDYKWTDSENYKDLKEVLDYIGYELLDADVAGEYNDIKAYYNCLVRMS